jgi:hypothetical protein
MGISGGLKNENSSTLKKALHIGASQVKMGLDIRVVLGTTSG